MACRAAIRIDKRFGLTAVAATCAAAIAAPTAGATEIGSVAAANPTIQGTPPGNATRRLDLGARIFANELVVTSEIGSGQFIFVDKTTLTVSPGSEIVLDRYVFDPERGVGEIALSLSKGVLRFIGGQITKTGEATVTTPHATIGIRGGIMAVTVGEAGTNAVFLAGTNMCVTGKSQEVCVTRSGGMVRVRPPVAGERDGEGAQAGEPVYEGVATNEQVGEIYGAADTGGDGGTTEPIEADTVETMTSTSGLADVGADSPAATEPPATETTTTTADQGSDGAEPDPVSDVRDDPDTAPISGGGDAATPAQPIPGLTGQAFVAPTSPFVASNGALVSDPLAQRVVEAPDSSFPFVEVLDGSRRGVTADAGSFLVPTPSVLGFYEFGSAFTGASLGNGASPFGPISGTGFHDPAQDFTVASFQTNVPDPDRGFAFFGMPTPGQLVESSGESVTARLYDFSPDFLWSIQAPLPPGFANVFDMAAGSSLYLVPQPNASLLGDPSVLGFDNSSQSKWLYGFLDIQGSGAGQSTLIAGLSARTLPNAQGAPTANDSARSFFSLNGGSTIGTQSLVAGNVQDPAGNTVFGDNGQYLLWGTSSPYLADENDPDTDFSFNAYQSFDRDATPDGRDSDSFGTLRLSTLEGTETIGGLAGRTPLAAPLAVTDWQPTTSITDVFTGGYAAGSGQSYIPTGGTIAQILPDPYVFRSMSGDDVRMGFNAAKNGAVAEFGPLDTFGSPDIFDIVLNFGNGSSRDAMLDDSRFEMDEALSGDGVLTGQTQSISGLTGTAPSADGNQTAARATLLSAGLVGDGGIFPVGTDTTPEWLRWGWWGANYRFDSTDPGSFASRQETIPLGTWVSGVKSDIAALGTSGSATYDGLATAHIVEIGGASPVSYVDGGRYLMTFDFGSRAGTASISGLVDTAFVSTISEGAATAGNHFGGVLRDAATFAAVGSIDGSFFTGGADPSAATAGGFDFDRDIGGGVTQTGAGIFAADKVPD